MTRRRLRATCSRSRGIPDRSTLGLHVRRIAVGSPDGPFRDLTRQYPSGVSDRFRPVEPEGHAAVEGLSLFLGPFDRRWLRCE